MVVPFITAALHCPAEVVYITQSHSSNMLTILDAIEKGNEKPGMDLDLDLDSGPDSHAQDSDDDMGLVFSPRPMRRSSSAVNVSLDVPHSALRPSNSMIDLPGVYVKIACYMIHVSTWSCVSIPRYHYLTSSEFFCFCAGVHQAAIFSCSGNVSLSEA
jgi:hypothetical protein